MFAVSYEPPAQDESCRRHQACGYCRVCRPTIYDNTPAKPISAKSTAHIIIFILFGSIFTIVMIEYIKPYLEVQGSDTMSSDLKNVLVFFMNMFEFILIVNITSSFTILVGIYTCMRAVLRYIYHYVCTPIVLKPIIVLICCSLIILCIGKLISVIVEKIIQKIKYR